MLDEVLELPAYQAATADVTEAVVALAGETAFVRAAQVLERLTGGVLSSRTIWRLVQQVGQAIEEAEAEEGERVFGQGQPPRQRGPHAAPRLYIEADGVMARQRTGVGRTVWWEVRCGLAYDDAGRGQVDVQGSGKGDFWEGASLVWGGDVGWEPGGDRKPGALSHCPPDEGQRTPLVASGPGSSGQSPAGASQRSPVHLVLSTSWSLEGAGQKNPGPQDSVPHTPG